MAMVEPHLPMSEPRSFKEARAPAPWWRSLVPLGEEAELIREIEQVRAVATAAGAKMDTHERECALRYRAIQEDAAATRKSIAAIESTINQKTALAIKVGWTLNWKAWAAAGALIASLLGALGYETAQLYGIPTPHHEKVPAR